MKRELIICLLIITSISISFAQNTKTNLPAIPGKSLKKVVGEYEKGLNEILKLNPIVYKYNGNGGVKATNAKHIGLLEEEYLKIAPEAATTYSYSPQKANKNSEQFTNLDASQIIYMLINAVKEQQSIIDNLKQEFNASKTENVPESLDNVNHQYTNLNEKYEKATLAQNIPNPSTNSTKINYFIPSQTKSAALIFTDISGKEVNRVKLNNTGLGVLNVSLTDLPTSIYTYTLIVDEKAIDTKEMIVKH